jgi:hypothetical protein
MEISKRKKLMTQDMLQMTRALFNDFRRFHHREERDRIVKELENLPFRWDGTTQTITIDKRELIALIKGETNE